MQHSASSNRPLPMRVLSVNQNSQGEGDEAGDEKGDEGGDDLVVACQSTVTHRMFRILFVKLAAEYRRDSNRLVLFPFFSTW